MSMSFVSPPSGAIGVAFAALNPPVDPSRAGQLNEPETVPAGSDHGREICGVVTIANQSWSPKKVGDIPHSITEGLGMQLSAHFAMVYNQSELARAKRRWAVVTTRGTVLILTGISSTDRPTNPADFPPCVQADLKYVQAELLAGEANAPRLALSIVPREWTVAIRRADCVETRRGGATC